MNYGYAVAANLSLKPKFIQAVRETFDEYLIWPTYSKIREDVNKNYFESKMFKWTTLVLLLDCILDGTKISFEEKFSSTVTSFPSNHVIPIIKTLVYRCPFLRKIRITICHQRPILLVQEEALIANCLSSLSKLTILELDWNLGSRSNWTSDYVPFYSQLGNCCAKLNHLILGAHFPFIKKKQALALVLGAKKYPLLSNTMKKIIAPRLKFYPNYITPICTSLTLLKVYAHQPACKYSESVYESTDTVRLFSFLLNHFTKLEIADFNSIYLIPSSFSN